MSVVKIDNNVIYQTIQSLSGTIAQPHKRIHLLALRSMLDYSNLLTLREINRRNGLHVDRVGKFDANRLTLVNNLISLKLVTLDDKKYVLTQLGKDLIDADNINLSKHLEWYLSYVSEEQEHAEK